MSILFHRTLIGPNWSIEAGTILDLDPMREMAWVDAGYATEWTEDDQRAFDFSSIEEDIDGLEIIE